jgi:hypothetical protein
VRLTASGSESPSEAGPVATAVADAVGGSEASADSGSTSGVAAPVDAPRRLHARASDQGFLPISVIAFRLDRRSQICEQSWEEVRKPQTQVVFYQIDRAVAAKKRFVEDPRRRTHQDE